MVKQAQTIRRQQPTNCLRAFDHFVGLVLIRLSIGSYWFVPDMEPALKMYIPYFGIFTSAIAP